MSELSTLNCSVLKKRNDYKEFRLTRGQSIGLVLTAESGLFSVLCVMTLLNLMFRNIYLNSKKPPRERRKLFQRPADVFVLSLFLADLFQGVGAVLDARWAHTGAVRVGTLCTAQGIFKQLGEQSVAINTLLIAVQTFVAIWFRKFLKSIKLAVTLVMVAWLYVSLFVVIGAVVNRNKGYEVPTPYWCWIGSNYLGERIAGEYLWLWLALLVSVFVYIPIFLWSRGYMAVDKDKVSRPSIRLRLRRRANVDVDPDDRPPALPLAILGYPFIYSIIILPLSLVRWSTLSKNDDATTGCTETMPSAAAFFGVFLFGLSGAANVFLMLTTRPGLLLFGPDLDQEDLDPEKDLATSQIVSGRMGNNNLSLPAMQGRLPDESGSD